MDGPYLFAKAAWRHYRGINKLLCRIYPSIFLLYIVLFSTALKAELLLLSPEVLDFGVVKFGQIGRADIKLENKSNDQRMIKVELIGDHFTVATDSLLLEAQSTAQLAVDFIAPQPGTYNAQLDFHLTKLFTSETYTVELIAQARRPELTISPNPLDGISLAPAAIGQQSSKTLVFSNPSSVPLTIDSLRFDHESSAFSVDQREPLILAPEVHINVELAFVPMRGGAYRDRLLIHSADLLKTPLEIPLRTQVLSPLVAVSPLTAVGLDYGTVEVGFTEQRTVTLLNEGPLDLLVDSIHVDGRAFAFQHDIGDTIRVVSGQQQPVITTFKPVFPGQASGSLILRTNDPVQPILTLDLKGTGQVRPAQVEILNGPTIAFGSVALGQTAHKYLLLLNRGGSPYTVEMTWEDAPSAEASGEFIFAPSAVVLQPGESHPVELGFNPKQVSKRQAILLVSSPRGIQRVTLEGTGKFLKLNPSTIDFGHVAVGKTTNQVIEIANIGNADFKVDRISITDDAFTLFTNLAVDDQILLPANGLRSLPLNIGYAPKQRGPSAGNLRLEGFWDDGSRTLEVLLNGIGIAAEIELHPSGSLDFGHVVLGNKELRSLVATNTGDTELQVEAKTLTDEISIEPSVFSLQPGQVTNLQLCFTPTALGERFGQVLLVSNDVHDKAQGIQFKGQGVLASIDLTQVVQLNGMRGSQINALDVAWNNTPIVVKDNTKLDINFYIDPPLHQALIGRKVLIEWFELDERYDPKGGSKQISVDLFDDDDHIVLVEDFNLRLKEKGPKRVRLRLSTISYPGAPPQSISQIFEAGGWKWDFEAKPLASLSIRPGRTYTDRDGNTVKGETERLILPGLAFAGWHNYENPLISGIHFTAIGDVLQAISTEKSIVISLGVALSIYKDRVLFGLAWDIYDRRPRAKRNGSKDFVLTFKYAGLF